MNKKVTKTFSNKMRVWIHDSMEHNLSWEVKQFPEFYGTWRFITTFTTASHLSLSWARSIKSVPPPHFLKIHFNTIPHLSLGLPSGLLPPGFPTKTLCAPLFYSVHATWPAHLILSDLSAEIIWWGVQIIKFLAM